jgi:hypothetical protein
MSEPLRSGGRSAWLAAALVLLAIVPTSKAQTLDSSMTFHGSPQMPAGLYDSDVTWARQDVFGPGIGGPDYRCCIPSELLTLASDNTQADSYAWPLFVDLNATTNPAATMASSQSTGVNVRATNIGPGSPWVAGFHSETHSGVDSQGATLGYNGEITRDGTGGTVYGMELQSDGSVPPDAGINIAGAFRVGINLHGNSLEAGHIDARSLTVNGQAITPLAPTPTITLAQIQAIVRQEVALALKRRHK